MCVRVWFNVVVCFVCDVMCVVVFLCCLCSWVCAFECVLVRCMSVLFVICRAMFHKLFA